MLPMSPMHSLGGHFACHRTYLSSGTTYWQAVPEINPRVLVARSGHSSAPLEVH